MDDGNNHNGQAAPYTKKVFFLHPHSVIQEQLVDLLVRAEFDVALLRDHERAKAIVAHFKSSILFCNVDDTHLPEAGWPEYVKELMESRTSTDVRLGILTYDPKPEQASLYLMDIGVSCGYIGLKLGLVDSARIILKTLEANEAKGGRRFVRVNCPRGKAIISVNVRGHIVKGEVLNLSSAGIACTLEASIGLKPGATEEDIQMQLWGAIVRTSMTYMGSREQEAQGVVHILLFHTFHDRESKGKVFSFIRKALQDEIDHLQL